MPRRAAVADVHAAPRPRRKIMTPEQALACI